MRHSHNNPFLFTCLHARNCNWNCFQHFLSLFFYMIIVRNLLQSKTNLVCSLHIYLNTPLDSRRRKRRTRDGDPLRRHRSRKRRTRRRERPRTPTPPSYYSEYSLSEGHEAEAPTPGEETAREEKKEPFHPSSFAPGISVGSFAKAAVVPEGLREAAFVTPQIEAEPRRSFAKAAESPVFPEVEIEPRKELGRVKPLGGGAAQSGAEKEEKLMADFDMRCLSIYTSFMDMNVEMEITEILSHLTRGQEWAEAFSCLTRPKRAATGLRYIRLLENYLQWVKKETEPHPHPVDPIDKEVVWLYLHTLVKDSVGAYTPRSFLLAFRFLGEAFGFSLEAFGYQRNKKLIESHSRTLKPKNKAPMIPVKTMEFLECCVEDPSLPVGYRIAAGKLRLCIQASMRWDDLSRTALQQVTDRFHHCLHPEWFWFVSTFGFQRFMHAAALISWALFCNTADRLNDLSTSPICLI